jgi:hypothetical protein
MIFSDILPAIGFPCSSVSGMGFPLLESNKPKMMINIKLVITIVVVNMNLPINLPG